MERAWDCVCGGIVVADLVGAPIESVPEAGGLALLANITFSIGGCASNVAVDLAHLHTRVLLSGYVGEDLFGRAIREQLLSAGVDTCQLMTQPAVPTSSTFVLNIQGEDRRFLHCVGANAHYTAHTIDSGLLSQARVLYIGGYGLLPALTPERVSMLFTQARELGVVTVLNVVLPPPGPMTRHAYSQRRSNIGGVYWDWVSPVLPYTDYFIPNRDEAVLVTGHPDVLQQGNMLRETGTKTVIITGGKDGAWCFTRHETWYIPAYNVTAVDATGTGDAFVAGLIWGLLHAEPLEQCLIYGTAMGARCVQVLGATSAATKPDELREFVRSQPLEVQILRV
ncbi:MAG: kinase [Planctomycetaceae bacterium]|nr:MAG: kinase [Planctomycetaceae bacterium]